MRVSGKSEVGWKRGTNPSSEVLARGRVVGTLQGLFWSSRYALLALRTIHSDGVKERDDEVVPNELKFLVY